MCKTHSDLEIYGTYAMTQPGLDVKNPREAECLVTPESFAEKQVILRGALFWDGDGWGGRNLENHRKTIGFNGI